MNDRLHHLALIALACLTMSAAQASTGPSTPATYSASFQLSPNGLHVLRTGNAFFDGTDSFPGTWSSNGFLDYGRPDAQTHTTDLQSYTTGSGGTSFVPTWGAYGYDDNRDIGGQGPVSFGGTFAIACGSPGEGCATGSHTASYAQVSGTAMRASVTLTDLYAKADTQASWSRGFSLDPYSSFTLSGLAAVSIVGDPALLDLGTRISNNSDNYMTLSSMSFGDMLGRARTVIGASVWGFNSVFSDISYSMSQSGIMSMTITNHSNSALIGKVNLGTFIDVSPPIPEPATWLMLLAGGSMVCATARKRKKVGASVVLA